MTVICCYFEILTVLNCTILGSSVHLWSDMYSIILIYFLVCGLKSGVMRQNGPKYRLVFPP